MPCLESPGFNNIDTKGKLKIFGREAGFYLKRQFYKIDKGFKAGFKVTPSISHRTHTQKILIAISTAYTRTCEARRNGGWGGGGEGDQQELAPTIILTPPPHAPPH